MQRDVDLFPHLALALAQWAKERFIPLPAHVPNFSTWRGTFAILAMRMNMRHLKNVRYPEYPAIDLLPQLFARPLCEWYPDPLDSLPDEIDPGLPLLHEPFLGETSLDEQVTLYLEQRDISGDISSYGLQAILDQRWMRELVFWGRKDPANREAEYRLIRRFLIVHPRTTEAELQAELSSLRLYNPALVGEKYEQACVFDSFVRHDGQYWICPHCQGFLSWIHGRVCCAKHICGQLYPGYQGMKPTAPSMDMRRLSWILHVRVCLPGQTEIALFERLQQFEKDGLRITLWPGVDAYDHRLDFPGGKIRWAIDVKDYESAETLARALLKDPFPRYLDKPDLLWQRAFYVIPGYRLQLNPRYLHILRNRTKNHAAFQDVMFCDEEHLVNLVLQELATRCSSPVSL
ncbi:hypothetical protein KSF_066350 [Reticulibacter mediterranei]|uniref:REase associating with pPIWI RE domain-containing protein n=1 Tax=Reticulibacter mediterranei TaxID=2778369 RepID=A0A8J3N6Y0_9CHLR|nr:hypothetical protein [Reticulibacter mediterranei]GHO96587.1 hypothetical protein KSF_066350 [Reticulibacter mediterranei]